MTFRCLCMLLFLALLPSAAFAGQNLTVSIGGRTQVFTAQEMLENPETVTITVEKDAAYKKAMTYKALPLSSLLENFNFAADKDLQAVAIDGFTAALPHKQVVQTPSNKGAVAYLAIEPQDAKWPRLSKNKPDTAGPFYIVWLYPEADKISSEQWPYGIAKLADVDTASKRWPQIAVAQEIPAKDPLRQGQALFVTNCMACHKMNAAGDSDVGPDLNLPKSPTEYFQRQALHDYIRNPAALRHWKGMSMPAFDTETLNDGEIDLIISYLGHMAGRKTAGESVGK